MVNDKMSFNLRITEELNNELVRIAKEERRSKNAEIEFILEEYVKNYNIKNSDVTEINQQLNTIANVTINKK